MRRWNDDGDARIAVEEIEAPGNGVWLCVCLEWNSGCGELDEGVGVSIEGVEV